MQRHSIMPFRRTNQPLLMNFSGLNQEELANKTDEMFSQFSNKLPRNNTMKLF